MLNFQEHFESSNISGVYGKNGLFLFSDFHDFRMKLDEAVYVEGVLLVLIKKGHAQLTIDGEQSDFYQNDLFCIRPNVVFESGMLSFDIEVSALYISPEYGIDLVHKSGIDWPFASMAQKRYCIKLTNQQSEQMQQGFSMLEYNINMPETPNKSKKIDTMMLLLVYSICDMMEGEDLPIREQTFSPKDNLMERFFRLLKMSNPAESKGHHFRSVREYAEQLNVTPKYFSTVCKNSLNKTAGEIIDEHIISSAKILLHDNSYSIKQIADLLGFANQSHFGTFFRRHTGSSPQNYRSNYTVNEKNDTL